MKRVSKNGITAFPMFSCMWPKSYTLDWAAARLQMTQPPLSQQIQQLEKEMGVSITFKNEKKG